MSVRWKLPRSTPKQPRIARMVNLLTANFIGALYQHSTIDSTFSSRVHELCQNSRLFSGICLYQLVSQTVTQLAVKNSWKYSLLFRKFFEHHLALVEHACPMLLLTYCISVCHNVCSRHNVVTSAGSCCNPLGDSLANQQPCGDSTNAVHLSISQSKMDQSGYFANHWYAWLILAIAKLLVKILYLYSLWILLPVTDIIVTTCQ